MVQEAPHQIPIFGPSNPAILLWVFQTLNTEIRVSKGLLIILSGHAIAKEETKSSCDGQKIFKMKNRQFIRHLSLNTCQAKTVSAVCLTLPIH